MRNLLITTVGKDNFLHTWSGGNAKNYDIITMDYIQNPTFKYPGIHKMLQSLLDYDYYWMPDEDIYLTPGGINKLFEMAAKYQLDLFQPSVEKNHKSFPSWPMFIHRHCIVEMIPMPFIEIMCPGFSREGLLKCIETFPKSNSGWGLDIIWAKLLGYQNMGLINSVAVMHTRAPMNGSNLYGILKEPPSAEMSRLLKEYEVMMTPYVHLEPTPFSSIRSQIRPSRKLANPRSFINNRTRRR